MVVGKTLTVAGIIAIGLELPAGAYETGESVSSAYPEPLLTILVKRLDRCFGQRARVSTRGGKGGYRFLLAGKAQQACIGTDPDDAFRVFQQGTRAQAAVSALGPLAKWQMTEFPADRIQDINTCVGADPQPPRPVLQQRQDRVVDERGRIAVGVSIAAQPGGGRIEYGDPTVAGAYP